MITKTNEKIRVRLESFNHELLMSSCRKILSLTQNIELDNVGIVALPTDKRIYCVLRSPHVDKDSREHFELRLYKRFIDISTNSPSILDLLLKTELPAGVSCSLKILETK